MESASSFALNQQIQQQLQQQQQPVSWQNLQQPEHARSQSRTSDYMSETCSMTSQTDQQQLTVQNECGENILDEDDMAPTPLCDIQARLRQQHQQQPVCHQSNAFLTLQLQQLQEHQRALLQQSQDQQFQTLSQKQHPNYQHQQNDPTFNYLAGTPTFHLPTILMAPSVLASVLPPQEKAARVAKTNACSIRKSTRNETPQDCLDRILQERGYGTNLRIPADQAGYDTSPSPLQLASFGTELVRAIHTSDISKLSSLLECGLSPNPCNQFRDSIVDLVCKRGKADVFACLVEHGCELRVCDGFGRTPLHHCCWANGNVSFAIVVALLSADWLQLLMQDKRGQTPLEYVRKEQSGEWTDFLNDNQDTVVAPLGGRVPQLCCEKDRTMLPDPPNALPAQLAAAVSSGQMSVQDVKQLRTARGGGAKVLCKQE
jgi:hypothetical protein